MKALILTAALVVSTTLSFSQKAVSGNSDEAVMKSSDIRVAVLQHSNDEVVLLMEKEPRELVKIRVFDGNKQLYNRRVRKPATANITYDISEFPEGSYAFKVIKDKKVVYSATIEKGSGSNVPGESETLADLK